jgi:hypothetical protein
VDADAARRQRPVAWRGVGVSGDSHGAQQHGHEAHSCQFEMSRIDHSVLGTFVQM